MLVKQIGNTTIKLYTTLCNLHKDSMCNKKQNVESMYILHGIKGMRVWKVIGGLYERRALELCEAMEQICMLELNAKK